MKDNEPTDGANMSNDSVQSQQAWPKENLKQLQTTILHLQETLKSALDERASIVRECIQSGVSYKEIADVLEISESAIRNSLWRAKNTHWK